MERRAKNMGLMGPCSNGASGIGCKISRIKKPQFHLRGDGKISLLWFYPDSSGVLRFSGPCGNAIFFFLPGKRGERVGSAH